jgi:hypothetical protein
LREFTTPSCYAELRKDILERGGARQQTDVVSLNADLLEVVTESNQHLGERALFRDDPRKPRIGAGKLRGGLEPRQAAGRVDGWLLAGIQQTPLTSKRSVAEKGHHPVAFFFR